MIKITLKREVITILYLPLEVIDTVVELVTILDDNYGMEGDVHHKLGE